VLKTVATQETGVQELINAIELHQQQTRSRDRQALLLAEKAWQLIQHRRMYDVNKQALHTQIAQELDQGTFNLYRLVAENVK
jgi:LAO/AO transport system kinase